MAETETTTASAAGAQVSAQAEQQTENAQQTQNQESEGTKTSPDLESLIQRAVDRATNKLGNENKKLRGEIETLRKANMNESEIKKLEIEEREKELAERDKALTDRENRLTAIKAIKEAGLDDGSDTSLAIVDFVMAEDENAIRERVKTFNALIERIVKAKVDGVFKANGRTPGVGSETATNAGGKNDSIAARLGKNTANTNKTAQSVLDHYIGGKK